MNSLFLLVLIGLVIAILFCSPIFSIGAPKRSPISPVCKTRREKATQPSKTENPYTLFKPCPKCGFQAFQCRFNLLSQTYEGQL